MKVREVAVCMLVAAVVRPWLPGVPLGWGVACLVVLGCGKFLPRWIPVFAACLLLCLLRSFPLPGDARRVLSPQAQTVRVKIRVVGDARKVERPGGRIDIRQPVRLTAIERAGEWTRRHGRVQLRWTDERSPPLPIGSAHVVTGVLIPSDQPYVGLRRASWRLEIPSTDLLQAAKSTSPGFAGRVFALRERMATRITRLSLDSPEERAVLLGLLLGMRTEIDDTQMNQFASSGLIHLFAISGLHLGLLGTLIRMGGRRAGWGIRYQVFWILPGLILFSWMTGMRASAVRALLMMGFFYAAPLFYRRSNGVNALAFAVVVILAIAPEQVFDPGFQFSILLVGGLLLVWPEVDAWLRLRCARDPWAHVSPGYAWCERNLLHPLLRGVGVSCVCVLLSTPLTAYYFSLVSPVGVLGNLIAVPLVFLLLASGFAVLPFLLLPDAIAGFVVQIPLWIAGRLLQWVSFLQTVPFGVQMVRAPSLWVLLCCGLILLGWIRRGPWRRWACYAALMLAGGLATEAFLHLRTVELVVLDAGRGQAGWIRNGRGEVVLVDTGSAWSGWRVAEALKAEGIDRIAAVILTHPDPHHVEGLPYILERWRPEQILVSESDRDHPLYSSQDVLLNTLKAGDQAVLGGWNLEVLHPLSVSQIRRADDRSLVLRFVSGRSGVLWMGGASESVEQILLQQHAVPPADVIVAGHSRGAPGLMPDFLAEVAPRLVLVSGEGYGGVTENRRETERRVRTMGVALESPDPMGQIRVRLRSGGISQ